MEKRDCDCITHTGPRWLHLDAIWYEQNHAIFEQAMRYEEYALAIQEAHPEGSTRQLHIEYNRWIMLRDNQLHCHAIAELERLREKERALKRFGE